MSVNSKLYMGNINADNIYMGESPVDAVYIGNNLVYEASFQPQPDDEIWYTSTDGNIITPYNTTAFGANIISNTYSGSKGIIKFDGPVTSIGNDAFYYRRLDSITIPDSVTSIGNFAFTDCYLTTLTIPEGVTSIGKEAFKNCSNLTGITIPSSVTTIGEGAFRNCSNLTDITIPNSVTSIDYAVFYDCSSLDSITCLATTPPNLDGAVFYNTNDSPIYVPAESVDAYKTATNWSSYASRIFAIPE